MKPSVIERPCSAGQVCRTLHPMVPAGPRATGRLPPALRGDASREAAA
jgi:hypothetical protein